jgi:hypothetical protein
LTAFFYTSEFTRGTTGDDRCIALAATEMAIQDAIPPSAKKA